MKIFNQDKTIELDVNMIDYEKGYLKSDKIFIAHYDAIKAKTAESIAKELKAQGHICNLRADGNWYVQTKVYANGGIEENEIFPIEAKAAYDEYEDIQIYVPYTDEELEEQKLNRLRQQREPLLAAFDKWEKAVLRGREKDDETVMMWYRDLLDLEEIAFKRVPPRIQYFISR